MSRRSTTLPGRVLDVLSSFGLTIVILTLLLFLTWRGTLEQVDHSLYEVVKRYFEAVIVMIDVGPLKVPFPGVYPLLWLLSVNLVAGGLVRIRKNKATAGVLIVHAGILLLMGGSLVEYMTSQKGHTTLWEGERSHEFQSYFEWEITVASSEPDGATTEYVIPGEKFIGLGDGGKLTVHSAELPFELVVHDFHKNAEVVPARGERSGGLPVVDGFALLPRKLEPEAERDLAGCYIDVVRKDGSRETGVVWGGQRADWSVDAAGRRYAIGIARRRWELPFTVVLDDFRKDDHPGIAMAKSYESDITKIENGVEEPVRISMNAPLRSEGYTLYQASFSEPMRGSDRYASTFAVVRNPADRIPLYACIVITIGLLVHFVRKLVLHVKRQSTVARSAA